MPGLANLHIRLGTNSSWLLLSAWIEHGPLDGRSAWIMPGFAHVFFLAYLCHILFLAKGCGMHTRLFTVFLLPFVMLQGIGLNPSLYFDVPAQYVVMAALLEWLRWNERRRTSGAYCFEHAALVLSCAMLAFTIKPIGAPVLVLLGLAVPISLYRGSLFSRAFAGRIVITACRPYGS